MNLLLQLAILFVGHVLNLSQHLLKTVFCHTASYGDIPLQKSHEFTGEAHQSTYQHGTDEASVCLNVVGFDQQVKIRNCRVVSKVLLSKIAVGVWRLHIRLQLWSYHWNDNILCGFIRGDVLNLGCNSKVCAEGSVHASLNIV